MDHALNFCYRNSSISVTFYWKAFKNFDEVRKKSLSLMVPPTNQEISLAIENNDLIEFEDDYGSVASIRMNDVVSVIGVDCQKDAACKAEQHVMQQKELAKQMAKAQNDPAVKLLKPANSPIINN